ncbi:MAG: hypothetical protein ABL877_04235 [Thiobacillus sp.]
MNCSLVSARIPVGVGVILFLVLSIFAPVTNAEISLTLKQSFVTKYKDRATIEADCSVDKSKGKANPASKDGDMHIAVRCPDEIKLPLVAEIINAKEFPDAISQSKLDEQSQEKVKIRGAWRIWNEHSGDETFTQGHPVARAQDSNPDHVFEIHPITFYGDADVRATFHPIEGYKTKDAEQAFSNYENKRSSISYNTRNKTVTIISSGLGYNYVDFQMQLNERPFKISDGYFVMARVRDREGHLIHRKRRMVFVEGTPPAVAIKNLSAGDCLRVLGIPRLNLSLVNYRVNEARKGNKDPLTWNLPYEIIVIGVYDSQCEVD